MGVYGYTTSYTSDTVYIIGGQYTRTTVAQFKKNQWSRLTDLNDGRYWPGSIRIGSQTIIVGGYNHDASQSTVVTELWNFETGNSKIIAPILPDQSYNSGIALYVVKEGYCRWLSFDDCLRIIISIKDNKFSFGQ